MTRMVHLCHFSEALANHTVRAGSYFPIPCLRLLSCAELFSDVNNSKTSTLPLLRSENE